MNFKDCATILKIAAGNKSLNFTKSLTTSYMSWLPYQSIFNSILTDLTTFEKILATKLMWNKIIFSNIWQLWRCVWHYRPWLQVSMEWILSICRNSNFNMAILWCCWLCWLASSFHSFILKGKSGFKLWNPRYLGDKLMKISFPSRLLMLLRHISILRMSK